MDSKQSLSIKLEHDQPVLDTKDKKDLSDLNDLNSPTSQSDKPHVQGEIEQLEVDVLSVTSYRLYKRRWIGLVAMALLSLIAAVNWVWFSAIANATSAQFGISLTQVNWLANSVNLIYLPSSIATPLIVQRWGMRTACIAGAVCLLLASWIRYAGAFATGLSPQGSYALLIIGQLLAGAAQPVYQVLGPKYSETWFNLQGRTTATMLLAIANPIGSALAQLIPPFISTPKQSILILAIMTSVCCPLALLVRSNPPTPPTYSGSHPSPPVHQTLLAWVGIGAKDESNMSRTERLDFTILVIVFGVLVAAVSTFSIFTNQIFAPVGYSSDEAGFLGATLLAAGIIGGVVTAPLFDRVLTHHLSLTIRCTLPFLAGCWIGLIFAVKPDNIGPLFAVSALVGIFSFLLLPVGLEMGCELTRSAETSSAILWFSANAFTIIFVLVEDALRDDTPPYAMRRALIFSGAFVAAVSIFIIKFTGRQRRREMDAAKLAELTERRRDTA